MPTFFASDFHLGTDARDTSLVRERKLVAWLDHCVAEGADAIYLVGDLFEFWFEWQQAVPRGYVRFLGKLAELTDRGLLVYVFTGNHDMWMHDYLEQETGVTLYREPVIHEIYGRRVLIGHGDGLGPGDRGYKRLKKVINAPWARWLYGRLHPNLAVQLAMYFSSKSRESQPSREVFLGPDREWLVAYSERKLREYPDLAYCIFGHRHLPIDYTLSDNKARYINLGEWLNAYTYLRMDPQQAELLSWQSAAPAPGNPTTNRARAPLPSVGPGR
ncbi:UDP-2,3-diacylglucosamine hydrolase [Neolewinella maritima]|uniref:UDP-2,3-diacylglucosamine hydrolase n=1 Tax=Neolewinella maritima TaxID=1383882 RepID=A0ABN8F4C2_9BACT|nr:UDP-2,3-diacylglucosamine diphosphatase [Neolewinella maritima]CAH1001775.1 UDP-2,3-diacylglucosamine hydrolase [Neolewinella maritima]